MSDSRDRVAPFRPASAPAAVRMRYDGAPPPWGEHAGSLRPGEYDVRRIVPSDESHTQTLPTANEDSAQPSLKARAAALFNRAGRSRFVLLATIAVVVLAVSGATFGYRAMTTPVTLSVDGEERQVRASGDTVGDVLEAEGIELTSHDRRPARRRRGDHRRHPDRGALRPRGRADRRRQDEHPLGDRDRRRRRAEPDRRRSTAAPTCRPAAAPRSTAAAWRSRSSPPRP